MLFISGTFTNTLRERALAKLVHLPSTSLQNLADEIPSPGQVLSCNDWETLLSLCKSSPSSDRQCLWLLQEVIGPFLVSCPVIEVSEVLDTRFKLDELKHPVELLAFELTNFLIRISRRFPSLLKNCTVLIDQFFEALSSKIEKINAIVSLIGFIGSFIEGETCSLSLGAHVWYHLSSILGPRGLLKTSGIANEFTDETCIRYSESGYEISYAHFQHLLAKFQCSLACTIIGEDASKPVSEYLLHLQCAIFDAEQSQVENKGLQDSLQKITDNVNLITDICLRSLHWVNNTQETFDLSSSTRVEDSLNAHAYFLDFLCLVPFIDKIDGEIFNRFTKVVSESIDRFLITDVTTSKSVCSIVTAGSLLNFSSEETSLAFLKAFPILVSSPEITSKDVAHVSEIFTLGLQPLNEDAVVSTIYSLNNLLTIYEDSGSMKPFRGRHMTLSSSLPNQSQKYKSHAVTSDTLEVIESINQNMVVNNGKSYDSPNEDVTSYHGSLFENSVTAAIYIASNYNAQNITALTITILTQKVFVFSDSLDKTILRLLPLLTSHTTTQELSIMLNFYRSAYAQAGKRNKRSLQRSITAARCEVSRELLEKKFLSDMYIMTLRDLLDLITACGEAERSEHHNKAEKEITQVAHQISIYLDPLAALLPKPGKSEPLDLATDEVSTISFRNIWFNMAVHGFHSKSDIVKSHYDSLLVIAFNTPALASDFPPMRKEVSFEMNTVLRRSSSSANIKQQRQAVADFAPSTNLNNRNVASSNLMFLSSTVLLETLRCEAGDCSKLLQYFCDPSVVRSNIRKCLDDINIAIIQKYTHFVQAGNYGLGGSQAIAKQLNHLLLRLPDRNPFAQQAAFQTCETFIKKIPSALCHHASLYTLLDLLTTMFEGVVDCQANRFDLHYEFFLKHSKTKILLPDSETWRKQTLNTLYNYAKHWIKLLLVKCNQDTKILLQSYVSTVTYSDRLDDVEYGVSFALEMAGTITESDEELSNFSYSGKHKPDTIAKFISQHSWRSKSLVDTAIVSSAQDITQQIANCISNIRQSLKSGEPVSFKNVTSFLDSSSALLLLNHCAAGSLVTDMVRIPFEVFTAQTLKVACNVWLTIAKERRDLANLLLVDVGYCWLESIDQRKGLFSREHDLPAEAYQPMYYSPYDKKAINRTAHEASQLFQTHSHVIKFFASHFEGTMFQSKSLLKMFTQWVIHGLNNLKYASLHPFARMVRHELLNFSVLLLTVNFRQGTGYVSILSKAIVHGGLSWFRKGQSWPFGSNELKIKADLSLAIQLKGQLEKVSHTISRYCADELKLLQIFLASEIRHIQTWLMPMTKLEGGDYREPEPELIVTAFQESPALAIAFLQRFPGKKQEELLKNLVIKSPLECVGVPQCLEVYLSGKSSKTTLDTHYVTYWCPVSTIKSINLLLSDWNTNAFVLQYCVFSLEAHPVNVTFFYVPQIVQCLRFDHSGYVEKLILDTAKTSVLFAHQIIWNMLANSYKDDEGEVEDELKPTLDRVRDRMMSTFGPDELEFCEREFGFFNDITGISGKLKPYIKKTKAEKKHKIDEEMQKIQLKPDVYLPSNPDGVVVDINRKSGKPLQSHAKAPFMATFKIKKEVEDSETGKKVEIEKWQAAIFKVGDDCRQDVLALQLISVFRTIWSNIGLDVYVFPYRVTATQAGCGVIDVLPNSISRDMLGREAVNGLYEYFITRFGEESTIEFQNARSNFIKSLAGYSVISYLLQFKDRHNGNIMYDDQGHCLHIDFGFIFDIVPGGVKFEAVPFKLTKEMVKVMGGSPDTQPYRDFEELCVKAYLAARPHIDFISECVIPMLHSGLPCFKGMKTIKHLHNRLQPNKTDHEAALFMKSLIKKSYESLFTKGYDEFQKLTNGIPY